MPKETSGDVIRINVTPKSTTFPWIKIFRHPEGIRAGKSEEVSSIDAKSQLKREELALLIGESIISASKILSTEFPE